MVHYIVKGEDIQVVIDYFADKKYIQVDTETDGSFNFVNRIILIQLGDYETQFVINAITISNDDLRKLNVLLLDSTKTKIFHNAKFDIKFLWLHNLDVVNVYDTLLAERLLYAGVDIKINKFYALDRLAKTYCNANLDKSIRSTIRRHNITEEGIQYAADDVKYLEKIREIQVNRLVKHNMSNGDCQDIYTVLGLENNAVLAFASIEYTGIHLDVDKYKLIIEEIKESLDKNINDLNEIICTNDIFSAYCMTYHDLFTSAHRTSNVNWSSPQQKLAILQLLNPSIRSTSSQELSTFKRYDLVKKLIEYNKLSKLYNSFGENMFKYINPYTKRIHTEFWQILDTGRVSCKDPNLQQIPSRTEVGGKMRECFIPYKGNKIVGGDYSGCELRIIAEFSDDPLWINAFKEDKDLHSELCAVTFNIDINDVKKPTPFKPDIKYRDVQKTLNFGLAYGMSHFKLSNTIEITEDEAKDIIDKFFTAVPKVKLFLEALGNKGKTNGLIRTPPPYGRIRFFKDYEEADLKRLGEIERASKNHPIQGGNADMTKLALIYIYRYIKEHNLPVRLIHTVHDEIQTEVKEEFAEEWSKIMSKLMIDAANVILKKVPMKVDCKVSDYWSK